MEKNGRPSLIWQENIKLSVSSNEIFLLFVHVFLSLSMYSYCGLCILTVVYVFLLFVHVFLSLSRYTYCFLCNLRRGYPDRDFSVLFPRL